MDHFMNSHTCEEGAVLRCFDSRKRATGLILLQGGASMEDDVA